MDIKLKLINKAPETHLQLSQTYAKFGLGTYYIYVNSKTELRELIKELKKYIEVKWY